MQTFYSQQGEDIYIYNNFINKFCSDGIFVELGAMNGLIYSNTKYFEDNLGMTGVLIEPTAQYNELIKNRPNCKCYNLAVNYTKDKVKFLGDYATAGLVDTMNDTFRKGWHQNSIEYEVDGEPISEILNKSNIEYIDLITIDVEGGEEVVLKTFDFKIPIYVVCIELDEHNPEKDERCRAILIENGFTFNKRFLINEFWINNNYFRKDLLYDTAIEKKTFKDSIFEIGHFPYLERGLIHEIENVISHSIP